MKKGLIFVILMLVLVFALPGTVYAAGTPTFTVPSVTAAPGETVYLTIQMTNNSGIGGINLSVSFNNAVLELIDNTGFLDDEIDENDEYVLNGAMQGNYIPNLTTVPNQATVTWYRDRNTTKASVAFAVLAFKVKDTAPTGVYPLTLTHIAEDAFAYGPDSEKISLDPTLVNGSVTVADSLSASPASLSFDSQSFGAAQPAAQTVTLTAAQDGITSISTALFSNSDCTTASTDFTLGALSATSLGNAATATFTVQPKADLAGGAHNAWVKVSWNDGADKSLTIPVSYSVNALAVAPVTAASVETYSSGLQVKWTNPASTAGISHYSVQLYSDSTYATAVGEPVVTASNSATSVIIASSATVQPGTVYYATVTSIADDSGNYSDSDPVQAGSAQPGRFVLGMTLTGNTVNFTNAAVPTTALSLLLDAMAGFDEDDEASITYYYCAKTGAFTTTSPATTGLPGTPGDWTTGLPTSVGSYWVIAYYSGNSYYQPGFASAVTLTVAPVAPTLTLDAASVDYTPGTAAVYPNLDWEIKGLSDANIKSQYSNSTDVTWHYLAAGDETTAPTTGYTDGLPTNAGSYWVYFSIIAKGNYTAADSTKAKLTINQIAGVAAPAVTLAMDAENNQLKASWTNLVGADLAQISSYYVEFFVATDTEFSHPITSTTSTESPCSSAVKGSATDPAFIEPGTEYVARLSLNLKDTVNYTTIPSISNPVEAGKRSDGVLAYTTNGWTYGEGAVAPSGVTFNGDAFASPVITYEYESAADTWVATTPTNSGAASEGAQPVWAGDYRVKVTAGNDYYTDKTVTKTFTVAQADYSSALTGSQDVASNQKITTNTPGTYDLSGLVAGKSGFIDVTYSNPVFAPGGNEDGLLLDSSLTVSGAILNYTVVPQDGNSTDTIYVTVRSRNYNDLNATITFTAQDKTELDLSLVYTPSIQNQFDYDGNSHGISILSPVYYEKGTTTPVTVTGTLAYTYQAYVGAEWVATTSANSGTAASGGQPVNAGSYRALITLEGDPTYQLTGTSVPFAFTISQIAGSIVFNTTGTVYGPFTYDRSAIDIPAADTYTTNSTGAVSFLYYTDAACANLFDGDGKAPTNAGTYYMKATVAADTNHTLATSAAYTVDINSVPLTLAAKTATVSKTYDGTTNLPTGVITAGVVSDTYYTLTGILTNDTVTLSGSGAYANANAGSPVVNLIGLSLSGADAANYSMSATTLALTGEIKTKAVALTWAPVAPGSFTYTGAAQAVTATYPSQPSGTANAGISYEGTSGAADGETAFLNAGSYTVTATVGDNYCIGTDGGTTKTATQTYTIAQQTLTVAATTTVVSKEYSGSTDLPLGVITAGVVSDTYYTLTGLLNNDDVNLKATAGAYASAAVADSVAVNLTGLSLGGTDAANYSLSVTEPLVLSGKITPKAVTLTWPADLSFDYTAAVQTVNVTYPGASGAVAANVSFLGTAGAANGETTFKNAGSYTVTASIADTNYTISGNASKTATINQATVTLAKSAAEVSKTYDGTTNLPTGVITAGVVSDTYYTLTGVLNGDAVTLNGSGAYANANAGERAVNLTSLTLGGTAAGNYTLGAVNSLTVDGEIKTKAVALTWAPVAPGSFTYTGAAQAVTATYPSQPSGTANAVISYEGTSGAAAGKDVFQNAGSYTVSATVGDNYCIGTDGGTTKTATQTYAIAQKNVAADANVIATFGTVTYSGNAQTPTPAVKDGTTALAKGTDYDYAASDYSNNINAGTATLSVTFQGNYTGSKDFTFTINKAALADLGSASLVGSTTVLEPGTTMTAAVTANVPAGSWTWYRENTSFVNASATYTVVVGDEGKEFYAVFAPTDTDNYSGTLTTNKLIAGQANLSFDTFSINTANGTEAGDTVTATIVGGPDASNYTLAWYVAGNKVADGDSYTLTDADKGKLVTLVATAAGDKYKGTVNAVGSFDVTATVPGAPTVTAEGGKGTVTVNWTEAEYGGSPIQGYTITITNSHETQTINVASDLRTYTFTGLRPGSHYVVEVNAYNAIGDGPIGKAFADTPAVSIAIGFGEVDSRVLTVPASNGVATVSSDDLQNIAKLRITAVLDGQTSWIEFDGVFLRGLGIDKDFRVVLTKLDPIPVISNYAYSKLVSAVKVAIYVDGIQVENFNRSFTLLVGYAAPSGVNTDNLSLVHFDDSGKGEAVLGSSYVASEPGVKGIANSTSFFAIVNEAAASIQFSDVPNDRWSAAYIYYLAERGIVGGIGNNLFDPTANVTRAQFVKMLAGVAGADLSAYTGNGGFTDVSANDWFAPYVVWAVNNGVTKGVGNNLFDPQAGITRQEMATMIYRYIQKTGATLPSTAAAVTFADNSSIAPWAADAVAAMQQAGIINGVGDNTFAPLDNTTREAAAKMLAVTHQLLNK